MVVRGFCGLSLDMGYSWHWEGSWGTGERAGTDNCPKAEGEGWALRIGGEDNAYLGHRAAPRIWRWLPAGDSALA